MGEFTLSGIPSAPKGMSKIEVTFMIDENSILHVVSKDVGTGKKEGLTITNDKNRLNKDQIEKMIQEAEYFKESDE